MHIPRAEQMICLSVVRCCEVADRRVLTVIGCRQRGGVSSRPKCSASRVGIVTLVPSAQYPAPATDRRADLDGEYRGNHPRD
jgi:hypothetical protein